MIKCSSETSQPFSPWLTILGCNRKANPYPWDNFLPRIHRAGVKLGSCVGARVGGCKLNIHSPNYVHLLSPLPSNLSLTLETPLYNFEQSFIILRIFDVLLVIKRVFRMLIETRVNLQPKYFRINLKKASIPCILLSSFLPLSLFTKYSDTSNQHMRVIDANDMSKVFPLKIFKLPTSTNVFAVIES